MAHAIGGKREAGKGRAYILLHGFAASLPHLRCEDLVLGLGHRADLVSHKLLVAWAREFVLTVTVVFAGSVLQVPTVFIDFKFFDAKSFVLRTSVELCANSHSEAGAIEVAGLHFAFQFLVIALVWVIFMYIFLATDAVPELQVCPFASPRAAV